MIISQLLSRAHAHRTRWRLHPDNHWEHDFSLSPFCRDGGSFYSGTATFPRFATHRLGAGIAARNCLQRASCQISERPRATADDKL